jgi:hypothetical protein
MARHRRLRAALGLCPGALLALSLAAPAGAEGIRLARRVAFAEGSRATAAVKQECGLETLLPTLVAENASDVELTEGTPSGGRTLHLRISDVQAPGGGMFSGPKWLEVRGTLRQGGRDVASFRAKRVSTGGPFGGGGTCGMLQKCARAIAGDVATWLENPTAGAELGDAR